MFSANVLIVSNVLCVIRFCCYIIYLCEYVCVEGFSEMIFLELITWRLVIRRNCANGDNIKNNAGLMHHPSNKISPCFCGWHIHIGWFWPCESFHFRLWYVMSIFLTFRVVIMYGRENVYLYHFRVSLLFWIYFGLC